jgi:hypothetical protein
MRKVLLTTTALIALGGISAATADVNISGKLIQRYNQWSDDDSAGSGLNNSEMSKDLQLWIKSSAELDNGMTVGGNIRLRGGSSPDDRNYVTVGGDFGSITWGSTWAPIYSNSVGINWVDDVDSGGEYSGGSDIDTSSAVTTDDGAARGRLFTSSYTSTSGKAQKVIYSTPSISGLTLSVSFADAGKTSKGDHTSLAAVYNNGPVKLYYATETADHANAAAATEDTELREYGVQYSADFGRVWALAKSDVNTTNAGSETSNQEGNQFGIAYNMADNLTGVAYYTSSEENANASDNTNDEYTATAFGVNYTVGGGLSMSVHHTMFDYTDASNATATAGQGSNDGAATRIQMTLRF